jgi:hypothetical protein
LRPSWVKVSKTLSQKKERKKLGMEVHVSSPGHSGGRGRITIRGWQKPKHRPYVKKQIEKKQKGLGVVQVGEGNSGKGRENEECKGGGKYGSGIFDTCMNMEH